MVSPVSEGDLAAELDDFLDADVMFAGKSASNSSKTVQANDDSPAQALTDSKNTPEVVLSASSFQRFKNRLGSMGPSRVSSANHF